MERDFARVFTSWGPATDMTKIAVAACRKGYGIIPVQPHSKRPMCTLNARELKAAGERHPCGVHHAITDPAVARRVFARLGKTGHLNIGIVAHPSRIVVVDVDTPQAVESFLSRWAQAEEDEGYLRHSPTVLTPGSADRRHHDGGHYYFALPDGVELPATPGQLVLDGGGDVRWGMMMTVAPPSIRPEGRYVTLGEMREIPAWLLHSIRGRIEQRVTATGRLAERYVNDGVVRWSIETPWAELLERHGWTDTNKLDRCDCPIWEKPGGGTSGPKSATAHVGECDVMPNVEGHGALHLWTTDPPEGLARWCLEHGTQTLTKLQFIAAMEYDGDETEAKLALGLELDYGALWDASRHSAADSDPYTQESLAESRIEEDLPADQEEQPDQPHPLTIMAERLAERTGAPLREAKQELGKEWLRREARVELDLYLGRTESGDGSTWLPRKDLLSTAQSPIEVPANNGVLERSDGATLFPLAGLHQLFGQSEAGKTFLMLVAIMQRARAGQRSLYCDFEDTITTFVKRFRVDLGVDIVPWIEAGLVSYANPMEPPSDISPLLAASYDLVVVDSLSEVVASIADGSMKDGALIRRVLRKFRELADAGASVVIIAHGSEKVDVPTSSLGASEIRQALTGQDVLLTNEHPFSNRVAGRSLIYIAKDRQSATGGDTDLNPRAVHKSLKRLWGAMVVTPTPPDELAGITTWHTRIEIEPATHVKDEAKPKKIELAELAVIAYLNKRPNESSRVADMIADVVDEEELAERTVERAVRKLVEDGLLHVTGESAPPLGGKPSPIVQLGPAPEEES